MTPCSANHPSTTCFSLPSYSPFLLELIEGILQNNSSERPPLSYLCTRDDAPFPALLADYENTELTTFLVTLYLNCQQKSLAF